MGVGTPESVYSESTLSEGGGFRLPETRDERVTYFLTVCLGVGSWITINGVFQELPILTDQPEGWALASYITVVAQLANICPIIMLAAQRATGGDYTTGGVVVGVLSNILSMSILSTGVWTRTMFVGGSEHSVWLLILIFTASAADCLSSVTFWPFIGLYRREHLLTALSIGEGMSAVLPALLSFAQQPGADDPHFSANVYFLSLGGLMVMVGFSFAVLASRVPTEISTDDLFTSDDDDTETTLKNDKDEVVTLLPSLGDAYAPPSTVTSPYWMLFSCSFIQNGALLSTQAYTTQPYSNTVYQVTLASSMFIEPIGSCLTVISPYPSTNTQLCWVVLILCCTVYQLYLAGSSPSPPFASTFLGPFLTVGTSVVASFAITYLKTVAFIALKRAVPCYVDGGGGGQVSKVMQNAGAYIQLGSFLGASLFFLLIVGLEVFEEASGSGSW